MLPDHLVGPFLAVTMLLAAVWRIASVITRSYHWPAWCAPAAIGLFVLGIGVIRLFVELAREVQRRRRHVEQILIQHRYPYCHVTRLSSGRWFLTDKTTGREYLPHGQIGHAVKVGKTRDAGAIQALWLPPDTEHEGRD